MPFHRLCAKGCGRHQSAQPPFSHISNLGFIVHRQCPKRRPWRHGRRWQLRRLWRLRRHWLSHLLRLLLHLLELRLGLLELHLRLLLHLLVLLLGLFVMRELRQPIGAGAVALRRAFQPRRHLAFHALLLRIDIKPQGFRESRTGGIRGFVCSDKA